MGIIGTFVTFQFLAGYQFLGIFTSSTRRCQWNAHSFLLFSGILDSHSPPRLFSPTHTILLSSEWGGGGVVWKYGTQMCCGSVTFWYGSGSSDPYLHLTNRSGSGTWSGSGSCSFRQWPPRPPQKINFFFLSFYAYSFLMVHLHYSSKISHKDVTKQYGRYQGYS